MESAQTVHEEFFRGYKDGWQSVSDSGPPPPSRISAPYRFLIEGKPYYESGYIKGRADAAEQMPNA
jgi:hypothetical protein